jgi:hypothetical protein
MKKRLPPPVVRQVLKYQQSKTELWIDFVISDKPLTVLSFVIDSRRKKCYYDVDKWKNMVGMIDVYLDGDTTPATESDFRNLLKTIFEYGIERSEDL